ncbi:MAG: OsmC family peroxiredoxin [Bradyrhizobium sp.]|nr:MAG: OsmC family peroxiredoxin [Bradyrhizobium sp.]
MSAHTASVRWRRRPEERFLDGRYSRAHEWAFDGGARVPASSSPQVVRLPFSDPAGVDPEEALVASLSSCHMLFVLDFAKQAGFVVETYDDDAEGAIEKGPDGRQWMARVTLRPRIVFSGDKRPRRADLEALHHKAHEACYIANSVKSELRIEGSAEGLAED